MDPPIRMPPARSGGAGARRLDGHRGAHRVARETTRGIGRRLCDRRGRRARPPRSLPRLRFVTGAARLGHRVASVRVHQHCTLSGRPGRQEITDEVVDRGGPGAPVGDVIVGVIFQRGKFHWDDTWGAWLTLPRSRSACRRPCRGFCRMAILRPRRRQDPAAAVDHAGGRRVDDQPGAHVPAGPPDRRPNGVHGRSQIFALGPLRGS
jgi:hypothetical protein